VSLEYVHEQVKKFMASTSPDVLCITGPWGVGKTYTWNKFVSEAKRKEIGLGRYSYVSLFGLDSLHELKHSVFENTVRTADRTSIPSLKTLYGFIGGAETVARKGAQSVIASVPKVKDYAAAISPLYFLTVSHTLVCFDDLERKGKNLSIRDVMGLVSLLKEQKKCKVVLILNSDAFELNDPAAEDFKRYYEKVVDITLKFEPTSSDCVAIALPEPTESAKLLAEACISLGISNIRVIKKIQRAVGSAETLLASYEKQVLTQAVRSLAVFGWSKYEPNVAPPLDYLENLIKNRFKDRKDITPKEGAWNAALDACEFSSIDDFDRVLLEGIENGFFNQAEFKKTALDLNEQIRANKLNASFLDAWDLYHESFDDNEAEVVKAIYDSSLQNIQKIGPGTLNGTVVLFKDLGRPDLADLILEQYITHRQEPAAFNIYHSPFANDVTDHSVVNALKQKYSKIKTTRAPLERLQEMSRVNGWSPEDILILADVSVDEYYKILKTLRGSDLKKIINVCLQFDRIVGASPEMLQVAMRVRQALTQIGEESRINARRVRPYGIRINEVKGMHPNGS